MIVYQSGLWDIEAYGGNMPDAIKFTAAQIEGLVSQFRTDIERNYDLIRTIEPRGSFFFRTTPVAPRQILQTEFNGVIRSVGFWRGVGVLDWDLMLRAQVWSDIFRDNVHPRPEFILSFHNALVRFARCLSKSVLEIV